MSRKENPLRDFVGKAKRIYGRDRKEVCPVGIAGASAHAVLSLETNAREYGIDIPKHAKLMRAFGVIREANATVQREMLERERDGEKRR